MGKITVLTHSTGQPMPLIAPPPPTDSHRAPVGAARPAMKTHAWFGVIWIIYLIDFADRFALSAVLPAIEKEFALNDAQLGLLSGSGDSADTAGLRTQATGAAARLSAMEALSAAGIPVSLLFAPVIPGLNDCDMERIVTLSRDAGARSAAYLLLRLPLEIRELFFEWLHHHYPLRAGRVISLLRQSRGGQDYDGRFGHRMRGTGTFADLLEQRFRATCRRVGITQGETPPLRTDLFRRPRGDQLDLFG